MNKLALEIASLEEKIGLISTCTSVVYGLFSIVGMFMIYRYMDQNKTKSLIGAVLYTVIMLALTVYLVIMPEQDKKVPENIELIFQFLVVGYGFLVSFYNFEVVDQDTGKESFSMLGYVSVLTFVLTFGGEAYRKSIDTRLSESELKRGLENIQLASRSYIEGIVDHTDSIQTEIVNLDVALNEAGTDIDSILLLSRKVLLTSAIIRTLGEVNNRLSLYDQEVQRRSDSVQNAFVISVNQDIEEIENKVNNAATIDTLFYYNDQNRKKIEWYGDSLFKSVDAIRVVTESTDRFKTLLKQHQEEELFQSLLIMIEQQNDTLLKSDLTNQLQQYWTIRQGGNSE